MAIDKIDSSALDTNIDVSGSITADSLNLNAGFGSDAAVYGVRAWVNFDGTTNSGGNCTIRDSGNVSSVADNGTGDYTVNFTSAMPDTNYAISGSIKPESSQDKDGQISEDRDTARTTSSVPIITRENTSDQTDPSIVSVVVTR
jgi:hypothetical protein